MSDDTGRVILTSKYETVSDIIAARDALAAECAALRSRLAEVTALAASRWDEQASLRKKLAEAEATSLARYESLFVADKRLAEADALLREARPVMLDLLEIIRDASPVLPRPIEVKVFNKLSAATDRILKWCGGIDAHLSRNTLETGERNNLDDGASTNSPEISSGLVVTGKADSAEGGHADPA